MPPRRAKPGLTRMDAACDHLGRMGFSREEVRRTVKYLLKVYGGDDAWPFLEEDSYRVVIEAMLEKQETEPGEPPKLDHPPHEEPTGALEACESVNETYCSGETNTSHEFLMEGEDAKSVKALDISAFSSGISECGEQGSNLHSSSYTVCASAREQGRNGESCLLLGTGYSTRRRPPCYGWISEDEDEIVNALPPTTCKKQAMVQCSLSCHHDRKRKSRWDVKPDDK